VKRESRRIYGKSNSLTFDIEEHSVFLDDGSIATKVNTDSPVVQGIVSHDASEIVGQCETCLEFATRQRHNICQCCSQVVCSICAKAFEKTVVCPACKEVLERRRWILIAKKIFIDPFVERVG
jgi:hypothetical protein